jgi:hypothetical protein
MIQIRHTISQFIEKAMPYIVLILFLIALYYIFSGGASSSNTNKSNSVSEIEKQKEMLENQFTGFFGSIYLFFYKIWQTFTSFMTLPQPLRKLLSAFSQYKDGGPTVPRTTLDSGRCDNIQWIETTKDGQAGSCDSAIRPQDLLWTLNPQLNSEFREGSEFLNKNKNTSAWTNNLNIIIPWDKSPQTTFFVPQCEQAYFANQCRPELNSSACTTAEQWTDGNCCIKANLLKEQGLTCGLASFDLKSQYDKNSYSKNNKTDPTFNNITKINNKYSTKIVGTGASAKMASVTGIY